MEGPTHWPSAHDFSFGDCALDSRFCCPLHTEPDRPQCTEIILRLDCAHPPHHIFWLFERSAGEALVPQSLSQDIQACHCIIRKRFRDSFLRSSITA